MKEFKFKVNNNNYNVLVKDCDEENMTLEVNGKEFQVAIEKPANEPARPILKMPKVMTSKVEPEKKTAKPGENVPGAVKAPIPGLVVKISCKVGDAVNAGDTIMILEAMKMQNEIRATTTGTVKQVIVKEGESVLEGAVLASIQ